MQFSDEKVLLNRGKVCILVGVSETFHIVSHWTYLKYKRRGLVLEWANGFNCQIWVLGDVFLQFRLARTFLLFTFRCCMVHGLLFVQRSLTDHPQL